MNALQQVLHPNPVYENLLHVKPLSHQIFQGINYVGTTIQRSGNPNELQGKIRIGFGKTLMAVGYHINNLIALVEMVAVLAFAILASTLHLLTKAHFFTLQKMVTKINAYFINVASILFAQIITHLSKNYYSSSHAANSMDQHSIHVASALIAQFISSGFDRIAGRKPPAHRILSPAAERAIRILIEAAPKAIKEVAEGAALDHRVRYHPVNLDLHGYLLANPEHEQILRQFSFRQILKNPDYNEQFNRAIGHLFDQAVNDQLGRRIEIPQREMPQPPVVADQINFIQGNRQADDIKYQEDLQALIKKSFIELHDTEQLVSMLSKNHDVEEGRLELTTFLTTIQLAYYVQFQELKNDVNCPEKFGTAELKEYNHRRQNIVHAKARLEQLTEKENSLLVEMLLKTGDFDLKAQGLTEDRMQFIQHLFNDIGALAGQLHQGNLLAMKYVDLAQLHQGNYNGAYGAQNLFNGACQDAIKEIDAR